SGQVLTDSSPNVLATCATAAAQPRSGGLVRDAPAMNAMALGMTRHVMGATLGMLDASGDTVGEPETTTSTCSLVGSVSVTVTLNGANFCPTQSTKLFQTSALGVNAA